MVSVTLIHHATINGEAYLPGEVVLVSAEEARRMVYQKRATYTDGPPSPPSDPHPIYARREELAAVAFSGSYTDLTDAPAGTGAGAVDPQDPTVYVVS